MQNIQVICEKILSAMVLQPISTSVQTGSVFLDILASMSQESETVVQDETVMLETNVKEDTKQKPEVLMSQEMICLMMNQVPIVTSNSEPILNESYPKDLPIQTESNLQANIPEIKFVQETVVEESSVVFTEKPVVEVKPVETMFSLEKEVIVFESSEKSEIEKHFKVLSHSIKPKEIIRKEEPLSFEPSALQKFELKNEPEVKLSNLEMTQFKQSIEEIKTVFNQMSPKDDQTIVFKLKPEGLAEIVIKFEQKLGKVVLDISTSNRMVEQLIQKELPHLRDSLKTYQMEVNLNQMNLKDHSDQSHQPKYYQERQIFRQVKEEIEEDDWIFKPQMFGFNTYV